MTILLATAFALLMTVQDSPKAPQTAPADLIVDFEEKPFEDVIQWIAKKLDVIVQMDSPPPGRFTYRDRRPQTPMQAFDLIQGVLLDRGYTMVRKEKILFVLPLAEEIHLQLVPYCSVEDLDKRQKHEIVLTTFRLNSLVGHEVATELEHMLSPRGKMIGTTLSSRIVATDRVDILLQIRAMLKEIDPEVGSRSAKLKTFQLKHISTGPAVSVVRNLTGLNDGPAAPGDPLSQIVDFKAMGQQFGNRQMLQAFVPGVSLKGLVRDAPNGAAAHTRVAADSRLNLLIVTAEPDILDMVAKVVKSIDQPEGSVKNNTAIIMKSYPVANGKGKELGSTLQRAFGNDRSFKVLGTDTVVIVQTTEALHAEVKRIMDTYATVERKTLILPMENSNAKSIGTQLDRLFSGETKTERPTFLVDEVSNILIIRGTPQQLDQIKEIIRKMTE